MRVHNAGTRASVLINGIRFQAPTYGADKNYNSIVFKVSDAASDVFFSNGGTTSSTTSSSIGGQYQNPGQYIIRLNSGKIAEEGGLDPSRIARLWNEDSDSRPVAKATVINALTGSGSNGAWTRFDWGLPGSGTGSSGSHTFSGGARISDSSVTPFSLNDNTAAGYLSVADNIGDVKIVFGKSVGAGSNQVHVAQGRFGTMTVTAEGDWRYEFNQSLAINLDGGDRYDRFFVRLVDAGPTDSPDDDMSYSTTISVYARYYEDSPDPTPHADAPTLYPIAKQQIVDTGRDDTFPDITGIFSATDPNNDSIIYGVVGAVADSSESGFTHRVDSTFGKLYYNSTSGSWKYVVDDAAVEALIDDRNIVFSVFANDGTHSSFSRNLFINIVGMFDIIGVETTTGLRSSTIRDSENPDSKTKVTGWVNALDPTRDGYGFEADFSVRYMYKNESGSDIQAIIRNLEYGDDGNKTFNTAYGVFSYHPGNGRWSFETDPDAIDKLPAGLNRTIRIDTMFKGVGYAGGAVDYPTGYIFFIDIIGFNDTPTIISAAGTDDRVTRYEVADTANGRFIVDDVDDGDQASIQGKIQGPGNDYVSASDDENGGKGTAFAGTYGTLYLKTDGNWSYTLGVTPGQSGSLADMEPSDIEEDNFEIRATDGVAHSDAETVTIVVKAGNNAPTINRVRSGEDLDANDGTASGAFSFPAGTGVDSRDLVVAQGGVSGPNPTFEDGSSTGMGTAIEGTYGTLHLKADGIWTYQLDRNDTDTRALDENAPASDSFDVRAWDGLAASAVETITVTLRGDGNTHPTIALQSGSDLSITENRDGSAKGAFLFSDVDPEDTVVLQARAEGSTDDFTEGSNTDNNLRGAMIQGTYGNLYLKAYGPWTYYVGSSEQHRALEALDDYRGGVEKFEVRASDGKEFSSFTLEIIANGMNDRPGLWASPSIVTVSAENAFFSGTYRIYDRDVGDNPIVQGIFDSPDDETSGSAYVDGDNDANGGKGRAITGLYGTFNLKADGTWSYTLDVEDPDFKALAVSWPIDNEYGEEVFYLRAWDGDASSSPKKMTVRVKPPVDTTLPPSPPRPTIGSLKIDAMAVVDSGEWLQLTPAHLGFNNIASLSYSTIRKYYFRLESFDGNVSFQKHVSGGTTRLDIGNSFSLSDVTSKGIWLSASEAGSFTVSFLYKPRYHQKLIFKGERSATVSVNDDDSFEFASVYEVIFHLADNGTSLSAEDTSVSSTRFRLGTDKVTFVDTDGSTVDIDTLLSRLEEVTIFSYLGKTYGIKFILDSTTSLYVRFNTPLSNDSLKTALGISDDHIFDSLFEDGTAPPVKAAVGRPFLSDLWHQLSSTGLNYIKALFGTDADGQPNLSTRGVLPTISTDLNQNLDLHVTEDGDGNAEGKFTIADRRVADYIVAKGRPRVSSEQFVEGSNTANNNKGVEIPGTFGKLYLRADGAWTYELDSADTDTQELAGGDFGTDWFVVLAWNTVERDSSNPLPIAIRVHGANDAPTSRNATVDISSPGKFTGFTVNNFHFEDVDSGESLSSIIIASYTATGSLTIERPGNSVLSITQGDRVESADIQHLVYSPNNMIASADDSFEFKVNDGTADSTVTYTLTLDFA